MKSHPPMEDDLKKGMLVLFVPDENPEGVDEPKEHSVWHREVKIIY